MRGQRVVFLSPGVVALEDYSIAEPAADEILVETKFSVISPGTERANLFSEPNTEVTASGFPFYPGYSSVGQVLVTGKEVTNVHTGQFVAMMAPHQSHVNVKPPLDDPRSRWAGANLGAVDTTRLSWRIPDDLDSDALKRCATFIISMVGLYGVRRADISLGSCIIILGLGPIGLFAGQFARLSGGFPVIGVARTPNRRRVAMAVGFDAVHASMDELETECYYASSAANTVIIEATGRTEGVLAALAICPVGARLVLLGSTRGVVSEVDFYSQVHRKAITVIGSHQPTRPTTDYLHGRWQQYWDADTTIRMIRAGRIDAGRVITDEFRILDVQDAYNANFSSVNSVCTVLKWQ
jgi:2-desacetyl-2-hydroxyethyl bacteriochlorophyllide A dehydrogenase